MKLSGEQIKLERILLTEVTQTEKDTCHHLFPLIFAARSGFLCRFIQTRVPVEGKNGIGNQQGCVQVRDDRTQMM